MNPQQATVQTAGNGPAAFGTAPQDPSDIVVEVDAPTVRQWLDADEAMIVDVREMNEFERERIPGSLLMPLSFFDADFFPRIPGKKVILICAVGKRSHVAGRQLAKAGHPFPIHMIGGLQAWKELGFPTED